MSVYHYDDRRQLSAHFNVQEFRREIFKEQSNINFGTDVYR